MKRFFSRLVLALTGGLALWSCYPEGPEYYQDTDLTLTQHSNDFDFAARQTYALPDKIVIDVEIDDGDTTYVYMKDVYASAILQTIDANMSEYGWTKVDIGAAPDVVLTAAAIKNTNYYYSSYWYDWWWGGWYPGWGWYYPPYYTVSSMTTGSVIITMADPNVENYIDHAEVAWMMIGNGLASGANDTSRINEAIDQAFVQSPYLRIN